MSKIRALAALLALVIGSPATADYFEFTGTFSFPQSSKRFLPKGVSLSGSGIGYSSVAPNEIQLIVTKGFTGTLETGFASTVGYVQQAFLTHVGEGDFTKATQFSRLHGKMGFGGVAKRHAWGSVSAFPLTANEMSGLGLDGTLPATSGLTPSIRFGTWTTGKAVEALVITGSQPAKGTFRLGAIADTGSDARTSMGMGTVQLVSPIRTVSGVPADRAAIAKLSLTFAPEPGRGVLLVAGGLALAVLGAQRARRVISG